MFVTAMIKKQTINTYNYSTMFCRIMINTHTQQTRSHNHSIDEAISYHRNITKHSIPTYTNNDRFTAGI